MRRVAGIDLSLTCTGVAVCVQNSIGVAMTTETVTSKGIKAATLVDRHTRLVTLADEILSYAGRCDLAVIEGLFTGPKAGSMIDRAALFWFVAGGLIRREVAVAIVPPTSLKLAIFGSGKADKVQLALAVHRLWPDFDGNADMADAAGLAHLGAVWLGMDVPTLERHRTVRAEWPLGYAGDLAKESA